MSPAHRLQHACWQRGAELPRQCFCHHLAPGDREGGLEIPQFDYSRPLNFGSIEFMPEQRERLSQRRVNDPRRVEYARLSTLDFFEFKDVHLMKIDVEGMEMQVLDASANTLRRCRPILYAEFLKSNKAALRARIEALGYEIHQKKGINFLCILLELTDRIKVTENPPGTSGLTVSAQMIRVSCPEFDDRGEVFGAPLFGTIPSFRALLAVQKEEKCDFRHFFLDIENRLGMWRARRDRQPKIERKI